MVKRLVILFCRGLNDLVFGVVGLDDRAARTFAASGPADDLRQQAVRPLGGVVVLRVERKVRVQHTHERHVFKIQPLGNHLRAKKDGDILFFKFAQQRFMSA